MSPYFFLIALCLSLAPGRSNAASFDYSAYRAVLQSYVIDSGQSTKVRYAALKKDSSNLFKFNRAVSVVELAEFKKWTSNDQIAFLINSYNSFTLQLIVENYPLSSIKKIGGLLGNPWKKKFFRFLGEESSLDRLEHEILRENYKEPRIHFAVNCASIGCPPLKREPFDGAKLDEQLESAAKHFISSSSFNKYAAQANTLNLSSIFKWYGSDFGNEVDLRRFIAAKMDVSQHDRDAIQKSAKILFVDYDWTLNEAK